MPDRDRFGCYGYGRGTTPVIDVLARQCHLSEHPGMNPEVVHVAQTGSSIVVIAAARTATEPMKGNSYGS